MILPDFKAFPRRGRLIGIDWGAHRTGVAISDASGDFVFVRPQISLGRGGGSIARRVADLIVAEGVAGIVVGLPVRSDGSESDTTKMVRDFVDELSSYTDLPICFIEENLTSMAAQQEMGRVRRDDIKQRLDSESARIILENAIAIIRRLNS